MYQAEETDGGWTKLGLMKLAATAASVPAWEYTAVIVVATTTWLYHVLDFHSVGDLLSGFRGDAVRIFHSPLSKLAAQILPKCEALHRYFPTPWLGSPHLQTLFLHLNGRPPPVEYLRQLFLTPDGGTIALDWVKTRPVREEDSNDSKPDNPAVDETPVVIIIPGLTSDSQDAYVRHIAHRTSQEGWRTLVANHRGLGGVSITSDQFYNAGWTEDVRRLVKYVHHKYPQAPLMAIGTSIGANILVKYLGEEGAATPIGAAVAVCCPWDLVLCNRFWSRHGVQSLYSKALAFSLRQYARIHQSALSRIADWDLLIKSRTLHDFDNHCTRLAGNYKTLDTYYRLCSSINYLADVTVPLLCFSALDDPICTKEAIPWDECKTNPNVVLAVTGHGGHLGYFEGITAHSIWWARASTEFLTNVLESSLMHKPQKTGRLEPLTAISTSIIDDNADDALYQEITPEKTLHGLEAATSTEVGLVEGADGQASIALHFTDPSELLALQSALMQILGQVSKVPVGTPISSTFNNYMEVAMSVMELSKKLNNGAFEEVKSVCGYLKPSATRSRSSPLEAADQGRRRWEPLAKDLPAMDFVGLVTQNRRMLWLLAYVAVLTTCTLVGSALLVGARCVAYSQTVGVTC